MSIYGGGMNIEGFTYKDLKRIILFFLSKKGLIVFILFQLLIYLCCLGSFEVRSLDVKIDFHAIFAAIAVITIVVWVILRGNGCKVAKSKKGILICINTFDDEDVESRIIKDFVHPLKKSLKSNRLKEHVHLIHVPQRLAKTVDCDTSAIELMCKLKASFIVYGDVKKHSGRDGEVFYIDLNGAVAHKSTHHTNKALLQREFAETLKTQKIKFLEEDSMPEFELTSSVTECSIMYITGMAAYISREFQIANDLYDAALNCAQNSTSKSIKSIILKYPYRKAEILRDMAQDEYDGWLQSRDIQHIENISYYINSIDNKIRIELGLKDLEALVCFVQGESPDRCMGILNEGKRDNDVWFYNFAFLLAYRGNLKGALKKYKEGLRLPHSCNPAIADIENFIEWVLSEEPEQYQLHFCLGFINSEVKGDMVSASADYHLFLDKCPERKYIAQRRFAKRKISKNNN